MKEESILQKLVSLVEQKEKPLNVKEACKYLDIHLTPAGRAFLFTQLRAPVGAWVQRGIGR